MHFPLVHVVANPHNSHRFSGFAICNGCHGPISIEIMSVRGRQPFEHNGDLMNPTSGFLVPFVYPALEKTAVPEHVPETVATPFIQAVESRVAGHYDAAGAMYRKALDVGLKSIDPKLKGKLYDRIEKLATENKLTPSLKDWAHGIRLDGNDASHEEDPFTKPEADEMHAFTQLVLTYLFTLPEKVRLKGKKETPA
jgi:hypothetical protein